MHADSDVAAETGDTDVVVHADRRRTLGAFGEAAVAAWYRQRGATIVDRNWRVREGELDLVVFQRGRLSFVEVKTRRSTRFGSPVEAITPAKAARLRRLVGLWLEHHPRSRRRAIELVVASVTIDADGRPNIAVVPIDM